MGFTPEKKKVMFTCKTITIYCVIHILLSRCIAIREKEVIRFIYDSPMCTNRIGSKRPVEIFFKQIIKESFREGKVFHEPNRGLSS